MKLPLAVIASIIALSTTASAQVDPVPSFSFLPTGNGHGFQVFDANQNAITQFLEHPYRYLRPNPSNPDGEGIVRRDLAFDTYFGFRSGSTSEWLGNVSPDEVGYVDETNIIRSAKKFGSLQTESFFYSPFGYEGNAMVMLFRVTNEGSSSASAEAFSVHNFKMGSAPNPDEPGASGELVQFDPNTRMAMETGPGGGALVYLPLGDPDVSSCADGAWTAVDSGQSLSANHNCSGTDKVNVFSHSMGSLAPGASQTWGVVVLFSDTANTSGVRADWDAFAAGRDAETLLTDALAEWENWRTPVPGLSAGERAVWRQSETVLRMGITREPYSTSPKRKNFGMVLASLPPGGWHSGWVRDAVYAIVALARTGHYEEAKATLNFFLDAEAGKFKEFLNDVDYQITTVRYFGNGEEEADFSGQPTRNIEIDGWGLFLWAARTYVDFSGDGAWLDETTRGGERVYDVIRDRVAEALVANLEPEGMAIADASIWEVHWGNREHFTYTTAATARGLCDMSTLSLHVDALSDRDRYAGLSQSATDALRANFVDQNNVLAGSIEKLATGNYRDGAVVEVFTWDLIPIDDPIATATLQDFSFLRTPVGGYKRVEGSSDQYDSDEWILIDLRASEAHRRAGQLDQADALLNFVTSSARVNYNLIPELYNTNGNAGSIGRYTGSIPMVGYGAGAYQLTMLARAGHFEFRDCGEEIHALPDGGPTYIDGGPGGAGNDGGIDLGRTGLACVCGAAGRTPGRGELLLLVLVAGVWWTQSRRRRG